MALREKLRNWISQKWNYEIQCDVFDSLDRDELNTLARLYNIDDNMSRLQICSKLAEILQEKKNQYKKILDIDGCSNTMDPISGTDVEDIDTRESIIIEQNGQKYCFEIEGIFNNVFANKNDKNPYTNIPFTSDIKQQIKKEYIKYRKLKGRKFNPDKYASDSSLTAWVTQLSNYLPYTTGIDNFLNIDRSGYNDFIAVLERFEVYLDTEELDEADIEVAKDTFLREKKISLVRKLIKWILANDYINIRYAWDYFNVNEIVRYAAEGNLDKIKNILDKIQDDSRIDLTILDTALLAASRGLYFDIVEYLIEKGANLSLPEFATTKEQRQFYVNYIVNKIKNGEEIDVNTDVAGETLLIWASRDGDLENVKFLIEKGADVNMQNVNGETAIDDAKGVEIARYLIDKGAVFDEIALLGAIVNADLELVKFYIEEKGLSVNYENNIVYTPLYMAVKDITFDSHAEEEIYNTDIIEYLLNKGAKVTDDIIDMSPSPVITELLQKKFV